MSCDSTLRGPRNADLQRTYAITSQGLPFDLTGWTAAFNVYATPGAAVLLSFTGSPSGNQSSIIVSSASAGLVTLIVTEADMESLPLGSPVTSPSALCYDLLLTDTSGKTTRFTFGQFIVDPVGGGSWCFDQGDQLSLDIGASAIQIDIFGGAPVIDGSTLTGADIGALAVANGASRSDLANAIYLAPFVAAVSRPARAKLADTVNVLDFGADPIGTLDSSAAFQAAVNALTSASGGWIEAVPGNYKFSGATVQIGNGTSSAPNSLPIVGFRSTAPGGGVGFDSPNGGVIITSSIPGPAFQFNRTLGWGFKGISIKFSTSNTAAGGVRLYEAQSGDMEDVTVVNPPGFVVQCLTYGVDNLFNNRFKRVFGQMGGGFATSTGITLGGPGTGGDCALNTFDTCHMTPTLSTQQPWVLGYCDSNHFINCDIDPTGGSPCAAITLDYTANASFPNSNKWWGLETYANTIVSTGSPSADVTASPNICFGFNLGNNAPIPAAAGFAVERVPLSADQIFYVSPTGSASSFGLYAGNPAATIQGAYNTLARYFDLCGFTATIQLANGTFAAGLNATLPVVGGPCVISGDNSNPSNVTVEGATHSFQGSPGCDFTVEFLKCLPGNGSCIVANGVAISVNDVVLGTAAQPQLHAVNGGRIGVQSGSTLYPDGNAPEMALSDSSSCIVLDGVQLNALVGVTYSGATVVANTNGVIHAYGMSFTGSSVTGARYLAENGGAIDTNGGGANYFPGNSAGSAASGYYL